MDAIDIRDLRVGDWVYYDPNVFIEDEYEPTKDVEIVQIRNGDDIGIAIEECYTPIPLTKEILEKNGFVIYNQKYTSEAVYNLPGRRFYLETYNTLLNKYFFVGCSIVKTRHFGRNVEWMPVIGKILYVHQLQNILRDLGIAKEITI